MDHSVLIDSMASLGVGFLGSLHCLGMCGPIILAYSLQLEDGRQAGTCPGVLLLQSGILHHLAFHLGRLATYGFLGALAGLIFLLAGLDKALSGFRSGMTLAGGIFMVVMGFALLRVIPLPGITTWSFGDSRIRNWLSHLMGSRSFLSKTTLGMAVGFLPCGLSWAMIVKAATTQSPAAGFLIMVAFGLGTVPALLLPGLSASLLSTRFRLAGERLAALSVIAMGLILIFKAAKSLV